MIDRRIDEVKQKANPEELGMVSRVLRDGVIGHMGIIPFPFFRVTNHY